VTIPATARGTASLSIVARQIGDDASGGPIELTRLAVKPSTHNYTPPRPAVPLDASFADLGSLVGVDLPASPVAPGGKVKLVLDWKASAASAVPYTVFVHVLDSRSHVIGQQDAPPVGGTRPTTGWVAGEYLADPHELTVDPATPPGRYQVEVGLYDPATGARVATGTTDNRIVVGTIEVGAG
jgi:hypothetical protein